MGWMQRKAGLEPCKCYVTCARAIGTFIVAGLTISELEVALPELLTPSEFGRNGLQPPDNYRSSSCVAAPTGVR